MNPNSSSHRFELGSPSLNVVVDSYGSWVSEISDSEGNNLLALREWETPVTTSSGGRYSSSNEEFHADYMGGWHTLFPNAGDESNFLGVTLPFHGDVARKSWAVTYNSKSRIELETTSSLPLKIQRVISVQGSSLRIEDLITNLSPISVSFLIGHHPVFPLSGSVRVDLPSYRLQAISSDGLKPEDLFGADLNASQIYFGKLDLTLPLRGLYNLAELRDGWFGLGYKNKDSGLIVTWDKSTMSNFWMWIENKSPEFPWFGRAKFLGLEPQTSSTPQGLSKSASASESLVLEPGDSKKTWIELRLVTNYSAAVENQIGKGALE